jgi:leucyl aminopeptidase (aminopeptidase T)
MAPKDKRPTLTVKGDMFTPEFRAKLNKAARKRGQTQAQFVAEVLEQAATRVLTGQAEDAEAEAPAPALVKRMEETDARLEALAIQVQALTDAQKKTFWERIVGR